MFSFQSCLCQLFLPPAKHFSRDDAWHHLLTLFVLRNPQTAVSPTIKACCHVMSPELPELLNALTLLPSKINGAVQVLDLTQRNVRRLPLSRVFRGVYCSNEWSAN